MLGSGSLKLMVRKNAIPAAYRQVFVMQPGG